MALVTPSTPNAPAHAPSHASEAGGIDVVLASFALLRKLLIRGPFPSGKSIHSKATDLYSSPLCCTCRSSNLCSDDLWETLEDAWRINVRVQLHLCTEAFQFEVCGTIDQDHYHVWFSPLLSSLLSRDKLCGSCKAVVDSRVCTYRNWTSDTASDG